MNALFPADDAASPANGESLRRSMPRRHGFSLIELLMVVALMGTMMAFVVPAFSNMRSPADVTQAAYDVAGALENARAYATANNTYVWVGFFEEDASMAGTPGVGRVVVSTVASRDGSMIYNPNSYAPIPADRLVQVNKLLKIDNTHLRTAAGSGEGSFPVGEGTGSGFDGRPAVTSQTAQIGDITPPLSPIAFPYPLGGTERYTFTKVIQFSPRGEVCIASLDGSTTAFGMEPTIEIGLQPARGPVVDSKSKNLVAVQITGIAGNVTIYRK